MIGGGVVGLAVARKLAKSGREVVIAECNDHFGMETSSRNSEVIHAGLYYPTGSLKARLCVDGKERLYQYCESRGIPHRRTGKLIVATEDGELDRLQEIRSYAHANGVGDVDWVAPEILSEKYPDLAVAGALSSPSTGIIDSHQFMLSLLGEATEAGAFIAYGTSVSDVTMLDQGFQVAFAGADQSEFIANIIINAAGLSATAIARGIAGLNPDMVPSQYLAKGSYFSLSGASPTDTLVYPVPSKGGLGIHLTVDMGGSARFGPDVEWVDEIDYQVDPSRVGVFEEQIRRYWPDLPPGALQPAYAGVRPKLCGPNQSSADFRIDGPVHHGVTGLINLFGIESPGLTASLSIADHVQKLLAGSVLSSVREPRQGENASIVALFG